MPLGGEQENNMLTMVWIVTYRTDSKSPQQELTRYTKESADHFASGINDAGGVAVVHEDVEDIPERSDLLTAEANRLDWSGY